MYDVPMEVMASLNETAQAYAPGIVDSHSILFFGRCSCCLEKEASEKNMEKGVDKTA